MKQIIITGVPEHFNFPWLKVIEDQPFLSEGIELVWRNEPKGSGPMNKAIREESTDLAIILTESFIKDRVEGNTGKIIGWYVHSPLIWGVHVAAQASPRDLSDIKSPSFLISRFGSGSHLMAFLLAKRESWNPHFLKFTEIGDLEGAKKAITHDTPQMFLWEKFTTKPLVDSGLFKRIGEIPTPWPCFVLVASKSALEHHHQIIAKLRDMVYEKAKDLFLERNSIKALSEYYSIQEKDIKSWLKNTRWAEDNCIKEEEISMVYKALSDLEIISKSATTKPSDFVASDLVNWIKS